MAIETRVRWNDKEKSQLIEEARKVLATTPMKPLAALETAQRVLPRVRRRRVATAGKVAWFVKGIGTSASMARAERSAVARTESKSTAGAIEALSALKGSLVTFVAQVFEEALDMVLARRIAPREAARATAKAPARKKRVLQGASKKARKGG